MNEQKYKPRMTVEELWPGVLQNVGSLRHCSLIDKIAACLNERDEEVLWVMHHFKRVEDAANELGMTRYALSEVYRSLIRRASGKRT